MATNNQPTLSVIIPVFNREDLIVRCLDSVKAQKQRPLQVVVVDNNSSDRSLENARKWAAANSQPDFEVIVCEEEKPGAAAARQKGFETSTGEYVTFFDSDDVMGDSLASTAMEKFAADSKTDMVCWRCRIHDLKGKTRLSKWPNTNPDRLPEQQMIHSFLRTANYAMKRELLEKAGGWNAKLPVWNDLELGIRLLMQKPVIKFVKQPLYDAYCQKESITGTSFSSQMGKWEKTIDVMDEYLCGLKDYKLAGYMLRLGYHRRAILAANYYREGYPEEARKVMDDFDDYPIKDTRRASLFTYYWTRLGLRGAFTLMRRFYLRRY